MKSRSLMIAILSFFLISLAQGICKAEKADPENPIEAVKAIGDKLIRDTPFKYRLVLPDAQSDFNSLNFINFSRTFGLGHKAMAYAFTQIYSNNDISQVLELEHSDGCRIWLNGELVYDFQGERHSELKVEERSFEMEFKVKLELKKGYNNLLIQSTTYGSQWVVYLQPPSNKGAVVEKNDSLVLGINGLPNIDEVIRKYNSWLILGPFDPGSESFNPECTFGDEIVFGKMYKGLHNTSVTWTIPRMEVLGDVIDPKEWGTNYNWNYHNGGVAWGMQKLAEITGDKRYASYASDFCDFHLKGLDFVDYQVNVLNAKNSANSLILNTPLLDFTLAPSLPIIYRLRTEPNFNDKQLYEEFIERMLHYARFDQVRLPGTRAYTRTTPEKYTTWVDDMFMGIPFLVQASQYVKNEEDRQYFLNDAAQQVIDFMPIVWDEEAKLFMHAGYSSRPEVKLPNWSRANGWGIWAITEVLEALPKNHPQYKEILGYYRRHVESLVSYQDKSGLWHNVLDRPDSRLEVSGSSIFTMAMARGIQHRWIKRRQYEDIVLKAWNGIQSYIQNDGTVHDICYGTMCTEDENYYMSRPFYDNDTHGIFAVIFAGIEVSKMMNSH